MLSSCLAMTCGDASTLTGPVMWFEPQADLVGAWSIWQWHWQGVGIPRGVTQKILYTFSRSEPRHLPSPPSPSDQWVKDPELS